MASKTYEGRIDPSVGDTQKPKPNTAVNLRGASLAGDGDGDSDDADGDDHDEEAPVAFASNVGSVDKKENSKKPKKKKKNKTARRAALKQSSPPRVLLSDLFPPGVYPEGKFVKYENTSRITDEENRHLNRFDDQFLNDYRQAAEVHRQVRQWASSTIKPGQTLISIAEGIEDGVRALTGHQGLEAGDSLKAGMGFPVGLSRNDCAAHYNPNKGNKMVLQKEDVMKIDIGVHVNGRIVDSAFTIAFDPVYDNLLAAVKEATNTGISMAGIDVRMSDLGGAIQEVMESYEVEIKGTMYPVKAIRNITGHNINQYIIHGGKSVPFVKNDEQTKMEEGEVFAIETFGSTGKGNVRDDLETSHYSKVPNAPRVPLHVASARSLLKTIDANFGTLPFCPRFLDRLGLDKYLFGLKSLVSNGIVQTFPPLCDVKGSYTAQFEHTILLRETGKEIISRGEDY